MQGHSGGTVVDPAEPMRGGKVGCKIEITIYLRVITSCLSYFTLFVLFKEVTFSTFSFQFKSLRLYIFTITWITAKLVIYLLV